MKGIVKLKVPKIVMEPKLFVITLSRNGKQKRFEKVAMDLASGIKQCYSAEVSGYTMSDYVCHNELSVAHINYLFKNFNP